MIETETVDMMLSRVAKNVEAMEHADGLEMALKHSQVAQIHLQIFMARKLENIERLLAAEGVEQLPERGFGIKLPPKTGPGT